MVSVCSSYAASRIINIIIVTKASVTERDLYDPDQCSIKRSEHCQKVVRRRKRLEDNHLSAFRLFPTKCSRSGTENLPKFFLDKKPSKDAVLIPPCDLRYNLSLTCGLCNEYCTGGLVSDLY